MSPASGGGGGGIDIDSLDAIIGWIIAAITGTTLALREWWGRAHNKKQHELESRTSRVEKTSATVEQFEKLAQRMDSELDRLQRALDKERVERKEAEKDAGEKHEMNRKALERQGKALAREKSTSRFMREILVTLQGHLVMREAVVEQKWPNGRPGWLLPVPDGVLDPLPPPDDDYDYQVGG